mgnify:CR=1 FL=1
MTYLLLLSKRPLASPKKDKATSLSAKFFFPTTATYNSDFSQIYIHPPNHLSTYAPPIHNQLRINMGIFRRPSTKQVKPKNDERSKKVLTEEDLAKMTVFEREKYEEHIIQDAKSVELRKEFEQENEVLSFAELHSWFG